MPRPIKQRLPRPDPKTRISPTMYFLLIEVITLLAAKDPASRAILRQILRLVKLGMEQLPSERFTDYRRAFLTNIVAGKYSGPAIQRIRIALTTERLKR